LCYSASCASTPVVSGSHSQGRSLTKRSSPQAMCGQAVHSPALVIAVPSPERATTARRSGRRRPPEFPSYIECLCQWSKPILLGASPHQAAFPSECHWCHHTPGGRRLSSPCVIIC
jgi:hypothetical protein